MTAAYKIRQSLDDRYVLFFLVNGMIDCSAYGSNGTGCKVYESMAKAEAAGRRYLKRMSKHGFECDKYSNVF